MVDSLKKCWFYLRKARFELDQVRSGGLGPVHLPVIRNLGILSRALAGGLDADFDGHISGLKKLPTSSPLLGGDGLQHGKVASLQEEGPDPGVDPLSGRKRSEGTCRRGRDLD